MVIALDIPDFGEFEIAHVVFDFNGTLTHNGVIQTTTRELLRGLAQTVELHIITADTHGTLRQEIAGLPLHAQVIAERVGADEKRRVIEAMGPKRTVAVGNGRNDVAMLHAAALALVIAGPEGAARDALLAADVIFPTIDDALSSLIHPPRLLATLRG